MRAYVYFRNLSQLSFVFGSGIVTLSYEKAKQFCFYNYFTVDLKLKTFVGNELKKKKIKRNKNILLKIFSFKVC